MGWEVIFLIIIFVGLIIMEYLNYERISRIDAFLQREHKMQDYMIQSHNNMVKKVLPRIKKR